MRTRRSEHARGSRLTFSTLEALESSLRLREHHLEDQEAQALVRADALAEHEKDLERRDAALAQRTEAHDGRLKNAAFTLGTELSSRQKAVHTREGEVTSRESVVSARGAALDARASLVESREVSVRAHLECELLVEQLREANQGLTLALREARAIADRATEENARLTSALERADK